MLDWVGKTRERVKSNQTPEKVCEDDKVLECDTVHRELHAFGDRHKERSKQ